MNQSLMGFTAGMGAALFVAIWLAVRAKVAHRHELAPVRQKAQHLPGRPDSNH
jgi:hypothetical protein